MNQSTYLYTTLYGNRYACVKMIFMEKMSTHYLTEFIAYVRWISVITDMIMSQTCSSNCKLSRKLLIEILCHLKSTIFYFLWPNKSIAQRGGVNYGQYRQRNYFWSSHKASLLSWKTLTRKVFPTTRLVTSAVLPLPNNSASDRPIVW